MDNLSYSENNLKQTLIDAQLSSVTFKASDGYPAIRIRTNEEAAVTALSIVKEQGWVNLTDIKHDLREFLLTKVNIFTFKPSWGSNPEDQELFRLIHFCIDKIFQYPKEDPKED